MYIQFERIRCKNFGSYGNEFAEIEFKNAGLVCALGKNGQGKSFLLLDAITYVLFDRAFREVSKTKLVNSITLKNLVVEIEMYIGSDFYLVRRGQKPNIFEIYKNNELLNQDSSNKDYKANFERILGMNFKTFKQVVVLGSSSHKQFMNLPALDRRAVIEELLDLQIFTKMNLILKNKQQENIQEISLIENKNDITQAQIDITKKHINEIQKDNKKFIEEKKQKISSIKKIIIDSSDEYMQLKEGLIDNSEINLNIKNLKEKISSFKTSKNQLNYEFEKLEKEITFYDKNDHCPTCKQEIDTDFKKNAIHICKETINSYNTQLEGFISNISSLNNELHNQEEILEENNKKHLKRLSINSKIKVYSEQLEILTNELKNISINENIENHFQVLHDLQDSVIKNEEILEDLLDQKRALIIASRMLKDGGIKSVIIKQYIPVINKMINKYLNSFDFFVQFELDEEFEESIRSRFRDEFKYDNFSEGEKFRLNLSIVLAWRELAELRNSVSTNLLILDEIMDSSLDNQGTDDMLKLIQKLTHKNNIFIITHKSDINIDKFSKVIEFQKQGNFSKVIIN